MHIYIDESGQFLPLNNARTRAAAVAAVVIPSSRRMLVGRELRAARRAIGLGGGEIKGSSLGEEAVAGLLAVLRRHDVIAEAVVIDAGLHEDTAVTRFKYAQGARLLANITREHHPDLIQELLDFEHRLQLLPNQLFLQAFCLWQLIPRVLETATMFYSQRLPRELGSFVWRIDAKDRTLTEIEDLWTTLIGPIITTRSEIAPMGMMPGGDYSFYERFDLQPESDNPAFEGRLFTDMKKVLREDLAFVPSHRDLGIQAADLLVSTLARALNGSMTKEGWQHLAPLFVHRKPQTLRLVAVDSDPAQSRHQVSDPRWIDVANTIHAHSRRMITARTAKFLDRVRDKETGGA